MTDNPIFSILVVTYNSSWDKTRQTLYSVLCQKDIDFEIVLADDGSKENNFANIKDYFTLNNFTKYTLVENKQNQGTVKNILSGLKFCTGEYVKPISPGDFLYDEHTLFSAYKQIKTSTGAVFFGRCAYYSNEGDSLTVYKDKMNPFDVRPYLQQNYKQIRKNYFLNMDFITGVATIYKKEVFAQYLKEVSAFGVEFAEDLTMMYMLGNKMQIEYLTNVQDGGICWYEYGTGISTNGNATWEKRLQNDIKNIFSLLYGKKLIAKWIFDLHITKSWVRRQLIKLLHAPSLLLRRFIDVRKLRGYEDLNLNLDVLKKILET